LFLLSALSKLSNERNSCIQKANARNIIQDLLQPADLSSDKAKKDFTRRQRMISTVERVSTFLGTSSVVLVKQWTTARDKTMFVKKVKGSKNALPWAGVSEDRDF
jgi:hypothetical protein